MRNREYWQKRFSAVEEMRNKRGRLTTHQIAPHFDRAQATIDKEIRVWYQRFADNNGISLAEAKKLLRQNELDELKWDIEEYIKRGQENAVSQKWLKELENASAKYHISRLEALKLRMQNAAENAFAAEQNRLTERLSDTWKEDYYRTAFEVQKGFSLGFDVARVDENRVNKLLDTPWTADGQTFSDRIWKSKAQLLDSVSSELTQMCILGKAPDDAIAAIAKRMNVAKSQAGRLVMTENAYFGSAAQQQCYKDLDVEQYQIVATLDSRTSDICRHLDGKVFDMKDYEPGVTAPPFHVYCRTCTVPYFADNDENGMRAARDENGKTYYVPADMTYEEWQNRFTRTAETSWVTKKKTSNEYSVQRSVVNSKKFHDRFTGATKHHAVDEALYQDALKMLEHRDGTDLEDLAAFDARTGKLLARNDTSTKSGATGFSYEQYQATLDCPNGVVLLHNHPNSSRPSATDIKTLFENEQVERSVIACHNGEVHILSDPDRRVDIAQMYEQWYNQYKEEYKNTRVAELHATDRIYESGSFRYEKKG